MPNWNGPQPAPKAAWWMIHANFPQTRFLGIYNRRNIAGTNRPSLHAEGRALDIGLNANDMSERSLGDQLFQMFVNLGTGIGLQEIIWNRQIWSSARQGVHAHTGSPHTDHIHVGFTRAGSQDTNLAALSLQIAILRTGLEDLSAAYRNIG